MFGFSFSDLFETLSLDQLEAAGWQVLPDWWPYLLIGLGGLAFLLALLWTVGLVLPGDWKISVRTVYPLPPAALFPYISDLRRWPVWCFGGGQAPRSWWYFCLRRSIKGTDAQLHWRLPDYPPGRLVIMQEVPPEQLDFYIGLGKLMLEGRITLEPYQDGQTRLKCSIAGDESGSQLRKFRVPWFRRRTRKLIEAGLRGLHKQLEAQTASAQQAPAPPPS